MKELLIFILGKCQCGCNCDIPIRSKMRIIQFFKHGHNARGANNGHWSGGKIKHSEGYIQIYNPNNPRCDSHGYVMEHRLVYEEYYKCCLLKWIDIHHINGNRQDNRIENLEAITRSEHGGFHSKRYWLKC